MHEHDFSTLTQKLKLHIILNYKFANILVQQLNMTAMICMTESLQQDCILREIYLEVLIHHYSACKMFNFKSRLLPHICASPYAL